MLFSIFNIIAALLIQALIVSKNKAVNACCIHYSAQCSLSHFDTATFTSSYVVIEVLGVALGEGTSTQCKVRAVRGVINDKSKGVRHVLNPSRSVCFGVVM